MTREEAIYVLNHMIQKIEASPNKTNILTKEKQALEVAIEALKEMSVEEYRQRLMEVFHRTDHDELLTYVVMPKEEEFKSLENILLQYEYEPRPHGEWIYDVFDENYHCSECGKECGSPYDFCPNCGSDNREEGEAE